MLLFYVIFQYKMWTLKGCPRFKYIYTTKRLLIDSYSNKKNIFAHLKIGHQNRAHPICRTPTKECPILMDVILKSYWHNNCITYTYSLCEFFAFTKILRVVWQFAPFSLYTSYLLLCLYYLSFSMLVGTCHRPIF